MTKMIVLATVLLCSHAFAAKSPTAWIDESPTSERQFAKKIGKLEKEFAKARKDARYQAQGYVFDPADLHEIAKKGVGLPYEQMVDVVQAELVKRYPDRVSTARRWIFNVAGGAMGQLTVLYCSPKEYLIIFGTPIGTEGFSGRYNEADVWDFMIDGEMEAYTEGQYVKSVFKPGDAAYLKMGSAKGYKVASHAFMLEYMRGNIIPAMNFGIWLPTRYVTRDWLSAWHQFQDCGKIALKEIFSGRGK